MKHKLPTRYPLQRFLMISLLFVVGIITHTLLTDPHLSRALIEAEPVGDSDKAARLSTSKVVSADAGFASNTLLGIEIESLARHIAPGASLRLESIGRFVSGTIPIKTIWTEKIKGQETSISDCSGTRSDCTIKGTQMGSRKILASAENQKATATIVVTPQNGNLFSDEVPSWANGAVSRLFDAGIVQGYDDGRYGSSDTLTHGQVQTLMARILSKTGVAHTATCAPPFASDHYAVGAYCLFAAKQWLGGGRGYSPDTGVTRGETAGYLRRIFNEATIAAKIGSQTLMPAAAMFTDIPVSHPAFEDSATAQTLGLMLGHPDGHFGVDELLNRAEAAMLIERAWEMLQKI